MSEFQLCACGSAPGYPHRADCPRPLYNPTDAQFEQWEKDWLNMKTQHTPTPWRNPQDSVTVCNDETGKKVCDTSWGVTGAKEALANAEFIVRACNAHDELLTACKEAKAWLSPRASQFAASAESAQYVLNLCETAIAKATKT